MTDDDRRRLRPSEYLDDAGWLHQHDADEEAEAEASELVLWTRGDCASFIRASVAALTYAASSPGTKRLSAFSMMIPSPSACGQSPRSQSWRDTFAACLKICFRSALEASAYPPLTSLAVDLMQLKQANLASASAASIRCFKSSNCFRRTLPRSSRQRFRMPMRSPFPRPPTCSSWQLPQVIACDKTGDHA